ncbi:ATP-binding protein [Sorangium sp. So ce381]
MPGGHRLRSQAEARPGPDSPALVGSLDRRPRQRAHQRDDRHGQTRPGLRLGAPGVSRWLGALYRRVPRLLEESPSRAPMGRYTRLLERLAKIDVLVLDHCGLAPLKDQERRDMLEIFEDRHGLRSMVITSQIPVGKWHDHLEDRTIADAVMDRIVHDA